MNWRGVARGARVIEANRVLLLGIGEAPAGASASPPNFLGAQAKGDTNPPLTVGLRDTLGSEFSRSGWR